MKYVTDADGLYDPAVRAAMARFTGDADTRRLEAATALRAAAHAVERMQSLGAHSRTLSPGAVDLLLRLCTGGTASVGDLARAAGVSSRNVTGLVDTLERAGLVRRAPDPADRRSVLGCSTDDGAAGGAEFRAPAQRAMTAVFSGFTDTEVALLRHLCLQLVTNQHAIEERMANS